MWIKLKNLLNPSRRLLNFSSSFLLQLRCSKLPKNCQLHRHLDVMLHSSSSPSPPPPPPPISSLTRIHCNFHTCMLFLTFMDLHTPPPPPFVGVSTFKVMRMIVTFFLAFKFYDFRNHLGKTILALISVRN